MTVSWGSQQRVGVHDSELGCMTMSWVHDSELEVTTGSWGA